MGYRTEAGKNRGAAAYASQSAGAGARHQRFPGESKPIPITQYLFPTLGGRLLATRAVILPPPGRSSMRKRMPGFSDRGKRTPQPRGFTSSV
jgi:hypothetical protein